MNAGVRPPPFGRDRVPGCRPSRRLRYTNALFYPLTAPCFCTPRRSFSARSCCSWSSPSSPSRSFRGSAARPRCGRPAWSSFSLCCSSATPIPISQAKQLNGKELSFNNIRDADAAIRIIRDFTAPTIVALKHMNPCGIGSADTIEKAWDYAYASDPVSIFGGIVVSNREVDVETAKKMHDIFLEIIIAPSYSEEALAVLTTKKKNLRILALDFAKQAASEEPKELTGVLGGLLVQNQDTTVELRDTWDIVTERQPSEKEVAALEFAWRSVKYVKSNGIIITNAHQTLGVGPGQTNRVASVKIAIEQASDRLEGAVLASDAFFPFSDNVEEIAKAGIKAIIQPGGSVRDQDAIDEANKHGIAMVFTGARHFRH